MENKVAIVILHLYNLPCLIDCIRSLNLAGYANFSIYVVHNGRKNTSLINTLTPIYCNISDVIDTGSNLGFARANNIGIRRALDDGFDYVLLLNDDTEVAPDFLSILIDKSDKMPNLGMIGPSILFFEEPEKIWFAGARFHSETCTLTTPGSNQLDDGTNTEPIESDYITGCALLIKRDTIEKIGLLDERFFLYWEDVDWGLRAKKEGFQNFIIPSSHVWHRVSVSTGGIDAPLRAYHKTRSHLLMARIHAPKALNLLHIGFFRDIAWLLIKSKDNNRIMKARAYMAAIIDYHRGRTDRGPHWLWNDLCQI